MVHSVKCAVFVFVSWTVIRSDLVSNPCVPGPSLLCAGSLPSSFVHCLWGLGMTSVFFEGRCYQIGQVHDLTILALLFHW
jgi:hypothetical protein